MNGRTCEEAANPTPARSRRHDRRALCGCAASTPVAALRRRLVGQFRHPTGWTGRLAGVAMAWKNRARIRWTLELLEARAGERILELGPGPGVAVQRLIEEVPGVVVDAVEPSSVMRGQAARRNRRAIAAGRVRIIAADAASLPAGDATYDAAVASNVAPFWRTPERELEAIARVVRPGGRLVLTAQLRGARSFDEIGRWTVRLIEAATRSGWREYRREWRPMHPVGCVGVILVREPAR